MWPSIKLRAMVTKVTPEYEDQRYKQSFDEANDIMDTLLDGRFKNIAMKTGRHS